jgi:hypothetical protein
MIMANMPWLGTNEDQVLYRTPPAGKRIYIILHTKSNEMGCIMAVNALHANWFCVTHKAMRIT